MQTKIMRAFYYVKVRKLVMYDLHSDEVGRATSLHIKAKFAMGLNFKNGLPIPGSTDLGCIFMYNIE